MEDELSPAGKKADAAAAAAETAEGLNCPPPPPLPDPLIVVTDGVEEDEELDVEEVGGGTPSV